MCGMPRKNPPTIRMRRLGAQLRKIREERGLTLDQAAELVNISKSALNRMENAHVITRPHEVEYLLIKYEVTDPYLRESLLGLARMGRSKEWIKKYAELVSPYAGDFVRLEQDSSGIRTFQPIVIPGLLQTPEYARAVMESIRSDPPRDVDRDVAFRMARQEVLTRPDAARLSAVIGEAALRQRCGGDEVLHGQLRHLLEMSEWDNITVRVLPFAATRQPSANGAFTLLDVEPGRFTIAVIEAVDRSLFLEDDTDVARHSMIYEDLCGLGLAEAESRAMIERAMCDLDAAPKERTR